MNKHVLPLGIGMLYSIAAVVFFNLGWGLQFIVISAPLIVMYIINLWIDIVNLQENLLMTQQRLFEYVAATKKDFETMDESISSDIHEMFTLIASKKFDSDE